MDSWRSFQKGDWCENIDVRDFIQKNYTAYKGDESFLQGATGRTKSVLQKYNDLVKKEMDNGGVLDIDTDHVASLLSFEPGYLSKYEDIIVGLQTDKPLKRAVNPFAGKRMSVQACKSYGYEMSADLRSAFKYKTTHNDGVFHAYTDEMKKARHCGIITGLPDAYARGRIIGDYRRIALYGMDFLIAKKKQDKFDLGNQEMTDENIRLLEEISKQLDFMDKLIIMADQYGCDIKRPANSFKEAVQWLYFGYLGGVKEQNGAANSIGRITTFLDIYAERDIKENKLDELHAQEIIDDLVLKLRLVRHLRTPEYNELFAGDPTWVTTSEGGMSENGKTLVTKTSFRMLNTLYNLGSSAEPNITILWANNLPKGFKEYCSKVSIDTDSIQYENDDEMRKYHGDDYAIACCVSALTVGKQMQFFGARCNLAKVLLMALNGGKDEIYGEQIAPEGDIFSDDILDYDKVLQAYKKYMSWMANLYVKTMNIIHYMHDKYAYERLMMSLHDTNVERLMAFGISGFSVLADSLSAIKHANVKPIKDCRGIITDFEIDGDFPTYGNDDDRVDLIAEWICESFYEELCKTKAYRNAKHTLSLLTITSNVMYGKKTGNTPDGREKGSPFAPGANPMHGRDKNGALASLNSVAKLNYKFCQDGISNTFTIVPNALGKTEKEKIEKLTTILNGYFSQGSHHINVNVLDREKLVDAMDNPEKYPNLTIRVSGYAVNFNKLSQEQKREVIARTFHGSL